MEVLLLGLAGGHNEIHEKLVDLLIKIFVKDDRPLALVVDHVPLAEHPGGLPGGGLLPGGVADKIPDGHAQQVIENFIFFIMG